MFSEAARDGVVHFLQRRDVKQANCEGRDNQGWLLLKSLLLLTADSSVSRVLYLHLNPLHGIDCCTGLCHILS